MSVIGRVDSLWRYPVKSMGGEELEEAYLGFPGVYGDRLFAFTSDVSPKGFPFLTARQQREMLKYRPRFRYPDRAAQPGNLTEAERLGPGLTALYGDLADMMVDVETPSGAIHAIDDPALLQLLGEGLEEKHSLDLIRSDRALTDCRPVSLFSLQTVRQIGAEFGEPVDYRRFRANIYLDLTDADGFAEDALVGRSLRIGAKAVVSVLERDPRCLMITLDPDTGVSTPALLRPVAQMHEGKAGVYSAVLIEGTLRKGDSVELLD